MQDQNTIEEANSYLNKTILEAVEKPIPQISSKAKKRPPVAWGNEERIVRAEYKKHRSNPKNRTKNIPT